MHEPFIVIGAGRTGTSSVARVLHENMGISMGHKFVPSDDSNPDGNYEDLVIWMANREFFRDERMSFRKWSNLVEKYIESRKNEDIPWGFKENRMAPYLGFYLSFFDDPHIIKCTRDKELAVASMVRWWDQDEEYYSNFYDMKNRSLTRQLKGRDHLNIHFTKERISDEEIECRIRNKWMR